MIVFVVVAATILLLTLSHEQWLAMTEQELSLDRNAGTPQELFEMKVREDSILGTAEVLDSASAKYRIPIERAMELISEEAAQ